MKPITSKTIDRRLFRRFRITESGCWEWLGAICPQTGYGHIGISGYDVDTVHRTAWRLMVGEITDGLWVLHKCDNKICFNPFHLYLGTVQDNARDARERGLVKCEIQRHITPESEARRIASLPRGARHHRSMAKLTVEKVLAIKQAKEPQSKIAERYGICQQAVSRIKTGQNWGWLNA